MAFRLNDIANEEYLEIYLCVLYLLTLNYHRSNVICCLIRQIIIWLN